MSQKTVLVLKLANGDEVVGQHINGPQDVITLRRPLRLALVRDPSTGQPGKALMEWIMLAPETEEVSVYVNQLLVAPIRASKELADTWLEQTSGFILTTQLNG
jgi:hypothetical protein